MGIAFNSTLSGVSSSSTFHSFSICLRIDADCTPLNPQKCYHASRAVQVQNYVW